LSSSIHFPGQAVFELDKAGGVAARSREALGISVADRIDPLSVNDRHCAARLLQRGYGPAHPGQDHLRAERYQFRRILVQARDIAHAPAVIDPNISPDGPAQLLQPLHEGREAGLCLRLASTGMHEHADAPHPVGLLRARRQRPSHRATEQSDELPAPHSRPTGQKPQTAWCHSG
jgi:hypothetical protein